MNWLLNLKIRIIKRLIKGMFLYEIDEKKEDFEEIVKIIRKSLTVAKIIKKP